jgi:YVTN family beta-propeller protein
MVPKRVLRHVLILRYGFVVLCLLAAATCLMGQTNPYVIPVGTNPSALGVNPATNQIYVVNSGGGTVAVIDGGNLTAPTTRVIVGSIPSDAVVNPVTNKIYVSNSGSGTVSVIDGANPTATPVTVSVGTDPVAGAVNRVTNTYYVANEGSNSVSVINGATNAVTNTITVGLNPRVIALNPVTNKVYVANSASVYVIDGTNPAAPPVTVPAGLNPTAIAVNPVTNKVYVANNSSNNVTVIDGASNTVVTTVPAGTTPNAIGLNTVTNKIYVVNNASSNVTVIDGASNTFKTNITVGAGPTQIGVNSLTNQIYISNNTNTMSWIDGSTDAIRTTITLSATPFAIAVNPITNKVFVTNLTNSSVTVVDGDINAASTLGPASNPFGVAVNPVTNKIYVTNTSTGSGFNGNLLVIDGATNAATTVPAGSNPFAVAVNPVTNTVYVTDSPVGTGGSVTVINGADNSIAATVTAGSAPNFVAVNPVTNKIYASNSSGNTVTVINGSNPTAPPITVTVGNHPNGIAINQATNKLYVANIQDNTVSVIDGVADTVSATVSVSTASPFAVAVNPATNKVYVGGSGNGSIVTVIDAANNNATSTVTAGSGAYNLAVNAVTNKIYVANQFDNSVTLIDGSTATPTRLSLLTGSPYAVAVNPVTNKIYVTERGTQSNVVAVIDGASNTLLTNIASGNSPFFLDVNLATDQVYAANYLGNSVTAINVDGHQPVPLTTVITGTADSQTISPLPGSPTFQVFQTVNHTPSFTVNVTSAYSGTSLYTGLTATNPPPTQVYYGVDGSTPSKLGIVTSTAGANPGTFTITLPTQPIGLHVLFLFAAYGNEAGQTSGGVGNGDSPELGNLTAYPYVVDSPSTTTTVTSSVNPQTTGNSVTFTATVVPIPIGVTGPTGTVSFFDGTTLLGTGTLNHVSGNYVATYTTSSLALGSHTITATYSGGAVYAGSSGTLIQTIVRRPNHIVASGGGGQTTVYGTPFANPLVVTVTDETGAGVPNITVNFTGTGLSFTPLTATTNASGIAQVTANPTMTGSLTATASVTGVSTPASFSLTATQAVLTVKANDATRVFGQPNPTFTALITGFVNGDTQSVVSGSAALSTTATQASSVGTYPIVAAAGNLSAANYTFSFVNGNLVVTASPQSMTMLSISSATVVYGSEVVLTAVVTPSGATGLVRFFDGSSNLGGSASLDATGTAVLPVTTLPAGTHNITAEYEGDANVPPSTSNTVQLTVTQLTAPGGGPALTVKVNDATRTTTQPNPPFTYSTSGTLVNGDTYATAIMGTPTYSTAAGTVPGTFAVTVSGLTSANYTFQSLPGTLTVVETPTTTTLDVSPATVQYGDMLTLTATVAPGTATGNVGFFDGATLLGQATVSGGVATLTTTTLNAGTHNITALYNGDGTYATSVSDPQTITVAKRTAPDGSPALIATVEDESRPFGTANPQFDYVPSGVLVNGDTYDTVITGPPVYSTAATPTSPAGTTWPIDVNGLGSQNYALGIVKGTLTVVANSTTTALAINPTSSQYGDPVTLTATVTPSAATGTINFVEGSIVLGTGTLSGGVATLTTTAIHAGAYTIKADYLGDGNYGDSTSSPVALTVIQRNGGAAGVPALTVTVENATRVYRDGDPAFSYSVAGTLVNGDTYAGAVVGVPVYSTTSNVLSPPGSYSITVAGLNSRDYLLGFVSGTLSVTKATPVVTVTSSPNPSTYGSSVTFTATVRLDATGSVTVTDGATTLGTGTIASGQATLTINTLAPGTHVIAAQYAGDTNYNGATSATLSQVVNQAAGAPTVTVSPNPTPSGSPVTITATVPPGATGTVTFYDGTTPIGTATINNGTATITVPSFSQGTHSITANYGGDTNFGAGVSASVSLVITPAADFALSNMTTAQNIPPGASASYNISITSVNAPFTSVVTLTATNLPPGATYTYSPATVTPGSAGASTTFTVNVPKQSAAAIRYGSKTPLVLAVLLAPLALIRRTRNKPPRLLLWLLLTLTSIGVVTGCGAGGYFSETKQTYTITVTGTSGSLVHNTIATLTVE